MSEHNEIVPGANAIFPDDPAEHNFTLTGEYTDATVHLPKQFVEKSCLDQIQAMIDHEAFTNDVRIMSDCHYGAGAVIGFTMPISDKVIPNVIGVDIGCGVSAYNLGPELGMALEELDEKVRNRVPMGFGRDGLSAPDRDYYHIKNDFPWEATNGILEEFLEVAEGAWTDELQAFADDGGYDIDYYKELCDRRAGTMSPYFDQRTGISSMGTLGAGNHFIEIGESTETGDYWVIVHSGSRGMGGNTADYWQNRASELRQTERRLDAIEDTREFFSELPDEYLNYVKFDIDTVSSEEMLDWIQGAKGESFVDYDALKKDFEDSNPEKIEEIGSALKSGIPDFEGSDENSLDYLEGEEAAGYLIDMIFCQQYARESRRVMAMAVADILGVEPADSIISTHNLIDFNDGIIRKGATNAHDGERLVIPFNMKAGTIICRGKGNDDWHNSAPHGAGRVMSRTEAKDTFNETDLAAEMDGVYTSAIPLDEAPGAYKSSDIIEQAITPTADIIDRILPVINFKAD